ncbi:MAG: hypothetical protein ACOYJL_03350 [Tractidigestivibacter sp.]|jgi:hypothetical protein|uniref:hypothetical protein n=1 Tax=Tractidigestivibacter sp. TaxID=2847320 RepID=UPI003D8BC9A1
MNAIVDFTSSKRNASYLDVASLFARVFILVVVGCLVLSANTLYANVGDRKLQVALCAVCFLSSFAASLLLWLNKPLSVSFLTQWLIYVAYVMFAYMCVGMLTGSFGGKRMAIAAGNLAIAPFFLKMLYESDNLEFTINAFVVTVVFLAIASDVLWVLGPIANIIPSNCEIMSSWGSAWSSYGRTATAKPGWYGLLFVTQTSDDFGVSIVRNTGIYCEAPMYSYVLCIALIAEKYLRRNPRPSVCIILGITILTTISTTGIICLLLIIAQTIYSMADRLSPKVKTLLRILFIPVLAVTVTMIFFLFKQKIDSPSGGGITRVDDFAAGFKAWQNNLLVGNGFGADEVIQSYMSSFRSGNLGFSNALMDVLAKGGLLWFFTFVPGIVGFFHMERKQTFGMLCFLFIWTITNVAILPITLFCFGVGSATVFSDGQGSRNV